MSAGSISAAPVATPSPIEYSGIGATTPGAPPVNVTPTANASESFNEIKTEQDTKDLQETAQAQGTSGTVRQTTGTGLMTVGGALLFAWPIGTVVGVGLIAAGIILNVTGSKATQRAQEAAMSAQSLELTANATSSPDAGDPVTTNTNTAEPTAAAGNLANMANGAGSDETSSVSGTMAESELKAQDMEQGATS